jgi:hypothetical protein
LTSGFITSLRRSPAVFEPAATQTGGDPRDGAAVAAADSGWHGESLKTRDHRLAWWREARLGCFIHWGVYSGPGGEWNGKSSGVYAEHLMRTQKIQLKLPSGQTVVRIQPNSAGTAESLNLFEIDLIPHSR